MRQIHRLKIGLCLFALVQLGWSMFGLQMTGTQNIFPLYTWQIFHTQPDRFLTRYFLFIHAVNGKPLTEPTDVFEAQRLFPSINMYSLSQKIHRNGELLETAERERAIAHFNSLLLTDTGSVVWEVREIEFEVIAYFNSKEVRQVRSLGIYEASR